jgi:hypothetical protein
LVRAVAPAAYLVGRITGWGMDQEAGLLSYAVGLALEIVLLTSGIGAVAGAIAAGSSERVRDT